MYPGLVKSRGLVFGEKPSIGIEPTNLPDKSRYGNHGTHTNVTMVRRPSGLWVRSFNGSTSYVDLGNQTQYQFEYNDPFTFLFWLKTTGTPASSGFFGKISGPPTNIGYQAFIGNNAMNLFLGNGAARLYVSGSTVINDDAWHFTMLTYSGSGVAAGVKLFVDGGEESHTITDDDLVGNTVLNSESLIVGAKTDTPINVLSGYMSLFRVVRYVISEGRGKRIYELGRHFFGV